MNNREPWMFRLWLLCGTILIGRYIIGPLVQFLLSGPVQ
jgi:hypothetical protein